MKHNLLLFPKEKRKEESKPSFCKAAYLAQYQLQMRRLTLGPLGFEAFPWKPAAPALGSKAIQNVGIS